MNREEQVEQFLSSYGLQLDCWSPLEISDPNSGEVATGYLASWVINYLQVEGLEEEENVHDS